MRVIPLALGLLAAAPLAAQQSLTIYNDGRILVRRTLQAPVAAGQSTHRLALGQLEPGSVFSLDPAVIILRSGFDASVDEASAMRRAVGRTLMFETGRVFENVKEMVPAEVVGVDPERFRMPDGQITFRRPGLPHYPPELVYIEPTLTLDVRSRNARRDLPLGWFTGGASWQAMYQVVLGTRDARIEGHAVIPSSGLSADSAEVQLLAGQVGRAGMPSSPMLARRQAMELDEMTVATAEEAVGEAHLYSLAGRHSFRPNVTTTVALFEPGTTTWQRSYVVRGELPWYGPWQQMVEEVQAPVEVHYVLQRPRQTDFGDRPLPAGTWRLYEPDANGRPQLIGEAAARHTAAGEPVRLTAGHAFDLTARRVQTEFVTRREGSRTIATVAYRVNLSNAKETAVTIEVLEERRGEWSVLESSVAAEKESTTRVRFRVRVPAQGQAVLTYRVQAIW